MFQYITLFFFQRMHIVTAGIVFLCRNGEMVARPHCLSFFTSLVLLRKRLVGPRKWVISFCCTHIRLLRHKRHDNCKNEKKSGRAFRSFRFEKKLPFLDLFNLGRIQRLIPLYNILNF